MANPVGPFISLDNSTDTGARSNWCANQAWWTCQSIQFIGTPSNATAVVGDTVSIQVEARGSPIGVEFTTECTITVNGITAWVVYPNTAMSGGSGDTNFIVWSMNPNNPNASQPPSLVEIVTCVTGPPKFPSPVSTGWLTLKPDWVPTEFDFMASTEIIPGHVCVQVNMFGYVGVDNVQVGEPIGNDLSQLHICQSPQQAQRNVTLLPILLPIPIRVPFLAGIIHKDQQRETSFTLAVVPVEQDRGVDPIIMGVIQSSKYKDLTLKPASTPLQSAVVKKYGERCNKYVESLLCEPKSVVEDDCEGKGRHLHVTLPKGGELVSMVFEAQIAGEMEAGTVYVVDVVQTNDGTEERGGYRIGIIVVSEEE